MSTLTTLHKVLASDLFVSIVLDAITACIYWECTSEEVWVFLNEEGREQTVHIRYNLSRFNGFAYPSFHGVMNTLSCMQSRTSRSHRNHWAHMIFVTSDCRYTKITNLSHTLQRQLFWAHANPHNRMIRRYTECVTSDVRMYPPKIAR